MSHKPIGDQVRAWRTVRGLSQRALAERARVVYVLVARLELGQTDPRLSTLERLAEALSIHVVDLLTGPPSHPTVKTSQKDVQAVRRARREHGRGQYVTLDSLVSAHPKRPTRKRARGE